MKVRVVDDPAAFLEAAGPLLLADEARHNLALGLAGTLRDTASLYPEHRFWLVEASGNVVGAALRTPPYNLVLARPTTDEALGLLASSLEEDLPGVVGALPEVDVFAAAWGERAGVTFRVHRQQGIYALEYVRPVSGVPGAMRKATATDRSLLVDWWHTFAVEALHERHQESERIERAIDHRLGSPGAGIVLWDDQRPVSLAGFGGATPNGIRIGPVYTAGRRFCFLYTDLANPTSNRIYERIGYERVCESAEIAFEGPG
jgi:uncharacterized protein